MERQAAREAKKEASGQAAKERADTEAAEKVDALFSSPLEIPVSSRAQRDSTAHPVKPLASHHAAVVTQ